MTDPRPDEGPDREALAAAHRIYDWLVVSEGSDFIGKERLSSVTGADTAPAALLRSDLLTVVAALLPSPPASGGDLICKCGARVRAALESIHSAASSAGKTQGPFGRPYDTVGADWLLKVTAAALARDTEADQ